MSAASLPVDHAEREQIRTALDANLCVEAGAGTGKTTSLVERIVEVLASGRADAESLAVITFTEKAAAELSSRVRERLEEALRSESDDARSGRLREAARSLYRARIETIHSFAASLLRQRPVEAEVDPGFTVMTELEAGLAFDRAYARWLERLMSGEHPELRRALNLGLGIPEIRETAEALHRFRFLLSMAPFEEPRPDADGVCAWLDSNVAELREIESACENDEDKALPGLRALIGFAERCADEGATPEARERLVALGSPPVNPSAGAQGSWSADPSRCARMKELLDEYKKLHARACEELRSAALLGVLPHAERFVEEYEAERRREGVADFDDLVIWARDLLRDRPEVRRYFQGRFKCLMIDEFQDTDPIQVEITAYLTSDAQEGDDWRELAPAPGKLFVVGDPKQSIYRFRRADIAIYDEVKRGPLEDGLVRIRQNFRSLPGVIEWLNRTFDSLLDEKPGVQPANVELEAATSSIAPPDARPPVAVVRGGEGEESADALRAREARAVAALLRRAVVDERWPVRDRATGDARPAQWRDVAILLPARTGLESFEQALAAEAIPFRHEGSRDFFRRQEVRDLIALLRSIDDPTDRYHLIGALRSSAFGCSDEDIVVHRATGGAMDFRVTSASSDSEPVGDAYAVLLGLYRAREKTSLPELVQRAVEESRLVETALMLPDGAQAAANLLAIVDQARAFSAAAGGGLRAFCRWLSESVENEATEVDAGIAEEADDVVRVLTMHGAKGLEFPIVVTANLQNTKQESREAVADEPGRRLHFRVGSGGAGRSGHYGTPGYEERWTAEKAARDAERLRLLYVATTRARDQLVVPWFTGKQRPGPLLAALEPLLAKGDGAWTVDADELPEPAAAVGVDSSSEADGPDLDAPLTERAAWAEEHKTLIDGARRELSLVVASSVERSTRPLAAEASHSESNLIVSQGPPLPVGDALHLVMQRVSLPDARDLEAVTDSVCEEADVMDRRDEVLEMARRCLESESVKRAISSASYQREVPFTVPWNGGFATGRVDLVHIDGDGELTVVDYKTDEVSYDRCEAHAREHHSGQAEIYGRGIEDATGLPVKKVAFIFCRPAIEITIST